MKTSAFPSLLVLVPLLVSAGEEPLKPLGEDYHLKLETIEAVHTVDSEDGKVSIKMVTTYAGGNGAPFHHVCNVRDSYHDENMGDSVHSTNFDLGRSMGIRLPLRLEKVKDRLYRFSYTVGISNGFESALRDITYDLQFEENDKLARMAETVVYSSFCDMDGSKMGLVTSGPRHSIYYVEPEPGSKVFPGALFFQGTVEAKSYRGKIFNWAAKGEETEGNWYDGESHLAEGEIRDDGKTVVLKTQASERKDGEDVPVGPKTTRILRFKSKAEPDR